MCLPENQADNNTHGLFSEASPQYAIARPQYPARLFAFLCGLCPDLSQAWDSATGSGQAAVSLAERFSAVQATDISSEQIDSALKHKRVRYSVQRAEKTGFCDATFSLVTVAQALHWFDLGSFWHEVQRVLKPGGIFAAWAYTWPHVSGDIDDVIQVKLLNVIEQYWAPNNRLAWDGYAAVAFPFREIEPPDVTLAPDWNLDQFLLYLGTWSATRRCIHDHGRGFFVELSAALEQAWGSPEDKKPVTMEFYCRVGRHET